MGPPCSAMLPKDKLVVKLNPNIHKDPQALQQLADSTGYSTDQVGGPFVRQACHITVASACSSTTYSMCCVNVGGVLVVTRPTKPPGM